MPAPHSLDLRRRIVAAVLAGGTTQADVAARFAVGLTSVEDLLRRYRATGSVEPTPYRRGPDRLLAADDDERIAGYHEDDCGLTLQQLADRLADETGLRVSEMTVFRALVRCEVTRKKSRSMPRSA